MEVELDKEIKSKWLEALRSNRYAQCVGFLKDGDGFCCLGVLADVAIPNAWEDGDNEDSYLCAMDGEDILAPKYAEVFGLSDEFQRDVALMNDKGSSFIEIAEKIEREL